MKGLTAKNYCEIVLYSVISGIKSEQYIWNFILYRIASLKKNVIACLKLRDFIWHVISCIEFELSDIYEMAETYNQSYCSHLLGKVN